MRILLGLVAVVAVGAVCATAWSWRARLVPSVLALLPAAQRAELTEVAAVERRLLGLLRPHVRLVWVGIGITVAATIVGLGKPWPTKILVDDVLGDQSIFGLSGRGALALVVVLTVALFVAGGGLGLLQTKVMYGLGQRMIEDLRGDLFARAASLSLREHDARGSSDLVYRVVNDSYSVQAILLGGLLPIASALLTLAFTLVVMVGLDPLLTGLALVSVPLAVGASRRFGRRIRGFSLDLKEQESAVHSGASTVLASIRAVKSFGREEHEVAGFRSRARASRESMMRLVTLQTLFGLVVDFILAGGLALVTWLAAEQALRGSLSTGEVLVFVAYAGTLYGPVSGLAQTFGNLKQAAAGAERVFEVLDLPGEDAGVGEVPAGPARGAVRFDDVRFGYDRDNPVLHGIDLEVGEGTFVALVGPTGAGKSTIASLVLRLYDPDGGRVLLDGRDLSRLDRRWIRSQVAVVPQDPALFPVSVRENIRYGRLDATDAEVEEAARRANVLDELAADPRGLDAPLGDGGVTLSGGQRQRVAIARALLRDAPVVVLDEPTSALDATTEAAVMDAIAELVKGRTCLVIAHRLATVQRADQIVVLEGGRIVEQGSHAELLAEGGLYRAMHEARFGDADVEGAAVRQLVREAS